MRTRKSRTGWLEIEQRERAGGILGTLHKGPAVRSVLSGTSIRKLAKRKVTEHPWWMERPWLASVGSVEVRRKASAGEGAGVCVTRCLPVSHPAFPSHPIREPRSDGWFSRQTLRSSVNGFSPWFPFPEEAVHLKSLSAREVAQNLIVDFALF